MPRKQITPEQFAADVAAHEMTVKLDNDLHRHLVFRKPGDSNQWFEIVTWPGSLMINGDMGSWAFARIPDMFDFFRGDRINADYWAEKITSESKFGGPSKKFGGEVFKANVLSSLEGYGLDDELKHGNNGIVEALDDEVFCHEDDEGAARRALADFKFGDFRFYDSWETDGRDWTYHYLWCLHAIVWAIKRYDEK